MATEKRKRKSEKKVLDKKAKPEKVSEKKSSRKDAPAKKNLNKKLTENKAKTTVKRLRSLETKIESTGNNNEESVAALNTNLTRGLPQTPLSLDCKCMQRKTKFYCYRLIQGAWQQVSGIGYPTKESCEEDNCMQV